MQNIAAFGKRRLADPQAPTRPRQRPAKACSSETAAAGATAEPTVSHRGVPFLTLGLIAVLAVIFWLETAFELNPAEGAAPSIHSLVALGGLDRNLVFAHGQWWRLFTAPLLHASASHIIDNSIALLLAGCIFERLIGPSWFAALFVVSAVGGALGSLAQNSANVVSVGASGAITGLLAAAFVCSFIFESVQLRRRMQRVSVRLLVPALLPALLPLAQSGPVHVDYGAHIGGAIAGGLIGFLLSEIWAEADLRPHGRGLARAIALGGAFLSSIAFMLVAVHYNAYAKEPIVDVLMPPQEAPDFSTAGLERSGDLVERYPHDPRAHLLRGTYFLRHNDLADAERHLRAALDEKDILENDLAPEVEQITRGTLALVLVGEGRKPEAVTIAAPVCSAAPTRAIAQMRKYLDQYGICAP